MVAWALLTLSILWGFFVTTRVLGAKPRAPWLLDLHRFLGGLAVVFVVVHLVGLFVDRFVGFSVADLVVPFVSSYETVAMAWGIVAFYGLVAVELTSLAMQRLPRSLWKWIHRTSYLLFAFATVHSLLVGTDVDNPIVLWLAGIGVAEVAFLVVVRLVVRGRGSVSETVAERTS